MSEPPESTPPVHKRRPRYSGTHPRRFNEKYKELAPDRYPDLIEQLRARGQTPAGQHVPVLVEEALLALAPQPGERGVDATLGWGGHTERLLRAISPGGQLLALDADPLELPRTESRLRRLGFDETQLRVHRTNFAGLRGAIDVAGWWEGVDFVFADLGVSSMQLDDPARGFSFKTDAPLDMRMNPNRGLPASSWLARTSEADMAIALRDDADEPEADAIAAALHAVRGTITTTGRLAAVITDAVSERVRVEEVAASIRRVFQAIRIEVNDEFGALDGLLRQLPSCLRAGGRVAILTFHSGEDGRVKRAFDEGVRAGSYREAARRVVRASPAERRSNPRSSAAKLRWARA